MQTSSTFSHRIKKMFVLFVPMLIAMTAQASEPPPSQDALCDVKASALEYARSTIDVAAKQQMFSLGGFVSEESAVSFRMENGSYVARVIGLIGRSGRYSLIVAMDNTCFLKYITVTPQNN